MTDDIQEQPATKNIRFHARLKRLSNCIAGDPNIDEDLWALPLAALAEIARLRTAGEDLAEALRDTRRRHQCDCADRYDERTGDLALAEWEEARRD